jgi:coenzyme F420 hydrogenase subunit beta
MRWDAASGGAVTALLLSLKRQGLISGAVVTTLAANGAPDTFLASEEREIRAACGSKYMITSMTDGIRQMLREDGPLVVVALPCQINGLNRAIAQSKILAKKVVLTIGLFCGGTKDMRYRNLLLQLMHCPADELQDFAFRGQGWPGVIHASDTSGQTYTLQTKHPAIGQIWSKALFTPLRCLLCDDPLAGQADLAVGDPWRLDYAAHSAGNSLVVVRTSKGNEAISKVVAAGDMECIRVVPEADVITSQTGILWRRYYAWSRVKLIGTFVRGWREAARIAPSPAVVDSVKAMRALGRSFRSWRSGQ